MIIAYSILKKIQVNQQVVMLVYESVLPFDTQYNPSHLKKMFANIPFFTLQSESTAGGKKQPNDAHAKNNRICSYSFNERDIATL